MLVVLITDVLMLELYPYVVSCHNIVKYYLFERVTFVLFLS